MQWPFYSSQIFLPCILYGLLIIKLPSWMNCRFLDLHASLFSVNSRVYNLLSFLFMYFLFLQFQCKYSNVDSHISMAIFPFNLYSPILFINHSVFFWKCHLFAWLPGNSPWVVQTPPFVKLGPSEHWFELVIWQEPEHRLNERTQIF